MLLMDADVFDSGMGIFLQINVPENSGIDGLWTPVPAKHGVCFAQKLVSFHGAARNIIDFFMGFIRIIFDKTQHRTKNNLNFVFSGVQKFFCLEFPGTVHVICFCKECAVDADFRKCVKSFTHQNNMLLGQEFFIDIKCPGENIILPEQCACSILIGTVKWIFYFSGGKKPGKYSAGNLHIYRF